MELLKGEDTKKQRTSVIGWKRSKAREEKEQNEHVEERRNLEVEKEMKDKRERNRFVNKMSLNVE